MPQRRPKPKTEIDFIAEGGSEPNAIASSPEPIPKSSVTQPIKLRVPADLLAEIDHLVHQRKPSPSRHQWILEALWQKVERESASDSSH